MGGRSSIEKLEPEIRCEVDAAIKRGATIDSILEMLRGLGADVSRSAVGRYSRNYAELARRQRDLQSTARAFAADFGDADDRQGRLLIQLLTSIATTHVIPLATDEDPDVDGKELHFYARAVKDLISASKIDIDREAKIREEERKSTREKAAAAAETAARRAGASSETIALIRSEILGIAK